MSRFLHTIAFALTALVTISTAPAQATALALPVAELAETGSGLVVYVYDNAGVSTLAVSEEDLVETAGGELLVIINHDYRVYDEVGVIINHDYLEAGELAVINNDDFAADEVAVIINHDYMGFDDIAVIINHDD